MNRYLLLTLALVNGQSATRFTLTNPGMEFSPTDQTRSESLISQHQTSSPIQCAQACMNLSPRCRLFEFDSAANDCRLMEEDLDTGQIVPSATSDRTVGTMVFEAQSYLNYGQPCSHCLGNRLLRCVSGTCQCSSNAFFDGTLCRLKRYTGAACTTPLQCRTDLNLTCLRFLQCGRKSVLLLLNCARLIV
jgi:hypothetical protein